MARKLKQYIPGTDEYIRQQESYVSSPRHLKLILDEVFPIFDQDFENRINHIYRTYLWLGFIGCSAIQSAYVREGDVDFRRMVVRVRDTDDTPGLKEIITGPHGGQIQHDGVKELMIYSEAVEDLRMACELKEFLDATGWRREPSPVVRRPGDYILRGKMIKGVEFEPGEGVVRTVRPTITRAFNSCNEYYVRTGKDMPPWLHLHLNHRTVAQSGQYYRIFEEERMGIVHDIDPYHLENYRRWKQQFSALR